MAELVTVWNNNTLTAGTLPPPFSIPNSPNAKSSQINNQSGYWLLVYKTQSNIPINRIEPFSYITFPYTPDISIQIDTSAGKVTTASPEIEFVDYTTFDYSIGYGKGSTFFTGAGTTTISNGSTVNVGTMPGVTVTSGNVNAASNVTNQQLPVAQVYMYNFTMPYPANTTSAQNIDISFLPNGYAADVQKGFVVIKSALDATYTFNSITGKTFFADGQSWAGHAYNFSTNQNRIDFSGQANLCNTLEVQIQAQSVNASSDTLTIYLCVDGTATAVDVPDNYGVPVVGACDVLNDNSGTITTANTSQQILGLSTVYMRKYIFFQNISNVDMWINFGNPAAANSAGSILVPGGGGTLEFEGNFVPADIMYVLCATSGSPYTLKWSGY